MLWRRWYFGDWLPNTYYLRFHDVPTRTTMGIYYLAQFGIRYGGMIALVLLQLVSGRQPVGRWLAWLPVAALLYAAYAGGDELAEFRFYAPVVPLMIV